MSLTHDDFMTHDELTQIISNLKTKKGSIISFKDEIYWYTRSELKTELIHHSLLLDVVEWTNLVPRRVASGESAFILVSREKDDPYLIDVRILTACNKDIWIACHPTEVMIICELQT